jgi:hypothetical protein
MLGVHHPCDTDGLYNGSVLPYSHYKYIFIAFLSGVVSSYLIYQYIWDVCARYWIYYCAIAAITLSCFAIALSCFVMAWSYFALFWSCPDKGRAVL